MSETKNRTSRTNKKAIAALVAVVFLFSFCTPQARAQSSIGGNGGLGEDLGGVIGVGLSCALSQLGGAQGLQGTISSLFGKKDKDKNKDKDKDKQSLTELSGDQSGIGASYVPTFDQNVLTGIKSFDKVTNQHLTSVEKSESDLVTKESCLDKIVHYAATKAMDKITLAIVSWINSGFDNDAFYLSDAGSFFQDISIGEINHVADLFVGADENFPFGKVVMESLLTNLHKDFLQEEQFSLNHVLSHGTYDDFVSDFSVGGWAGYMGMLDAANNPFIQYMNVTDHIANSIRTVSADYHDQLSQSGGFLNQRECVLTATGDPGDHLLDSGDPYYTPPGGPIPQAVADEVINMSDADMAATIQYYKNKSICRQWRNLTPGGVISDQLKSALTIPTNQLLNADEFNEDIGLILDALLTQLTEQGLNSLQSADQGGNTSNNVLIAQVSGLQPGQVANGNVPPPASDVITGTGLSNIDLTDVQNQYISLASGPGGALDLLDELVAKSRALDYCVPGPNPRWLTVGEQNLVTALSAIPAFYSTNPDQIIAAQENQDFYSTQIYNLTGVGIDEGPEMDSYPEFIQFMQNVYYEYIGRMQDTQNDGYATDNPPPSMRPILSSVLNTMDNAQDDISFISDYLDNINDYLPSLQTIENTLDGIAAQNGGVLDPNNPSVSTQISLYNSIASHFVSQEQLDILTANIDYYEAFISNLNSYLNTCIDETVNNVYPYQDQRVAYPPPIYPFVQTVSPFTALPPPNNDGFLPGVQFGTGPDDINIEYNGVTIDTPANLDTFEAVLQSVY